jgi:hypothetical protein
MMTRKQFITVCLGTAAIATLKPGLLPGKSLLFGIPEQSAKKFKPDPETLKIFNQIILKSTKENWNKLPIGQLIIKIGIEFIGTPYKGGTIESDDGEVCRINMTALDCVTFYENSLCTARIILRNKLTFKDLVDEVTYVRYRNGTLVDYTSRLHYTSDYFDDNIMKRVVKDITKQSGGEIFENKVTFMSSNPKFYPALVKNLEFVEVIRKMEDNINSRKHYYIPKKKIKENEHLLQSGDIIAFTTNKKGLDYSHTGLVYEDDNNVRHLFHASSSKKQVLIDKDIAEYIANVSSDTGITVVRPI